ncbi:MAG: hypothetical protein B7Z66_00860 [Chromatiales bacterium 21-64-14]|nr:MAG: hypothetical protein B7Z66_00860 [Chromatiales bacterium 21-64-14]HQU15582.1 ABC transporter substrate binding protein [Gammaproteobacteria bacterium]
MAGTRRNAGFGRRWPRGLAARFLGLCLLLGCGATAAADTTVAVLYPDIPEPYRGVFTQIINGIESVPAVTAQGYAIGAEVTPEQVIAQVRASRPQVVIALGRRGLSVAQSWGGGVPVIAGAVLISPDSAASPMDGISLVPDPDLLFSRLKELAPQILRVAVVYNPKHNAWLIRRARQAARTHGLELVGIEATDLRTAVQAYRTLFRSADASRVALWLPPDSTTVDPRAVLPLVLQDAWDKGMAVFSSNPSYVQRGVLFALYPDNVAMGRSLADMAIQARAGWPDGRPGIRFLRDLLIAVNVRTADHLGLSFTARQVRGFNLIFPASQ